MGIPDVLPFHEESALSQRCFLASGSVCSAMLSFQAEFAAVFLSNPRNSHSFSGTPPSKQGEETFIALVKGARHWNKLDLI